MSTPMGSGLALPVGDTASITVAPDAPDDQYKAFHSLAALTADPKDGRQALAAIGLLDFAKALAASRAGGAAR